MKPELKQFKLTMPSDLKRLVAIRAAQNMRSLTAEINFILREKMEAGFEFGDGPASSSNSADLAGGASITTGIRGTNDE